MADHSKDENNIVVGVIPTYQGFYAQGDSREDARRNLHEVIESIIVLKLQAGDKQLIKQIQQFSKQVQHV